MTTLATKAPRHLTRPLKTLVPLIQRELEAGETAGFEHYCKAGEMLTEAKAQMPWGNWTQWLKQNFALSERTASRYMRLARRVRENPEIGRSATDLDYTAIVGERRPSRTEVDGAWRKIAKEARALDAELFAQERQTEAEEVRVHREMAVELIKLGYRAMATRLHPDHGGSKDAMLRLQRIREHLTSVAERARFV
jgi:Protein of unknown function (DUF3102)